MKHIPLLALGLGLAASTPFALPGSPDCWISVAHAAQDVSFDNISSTVGGASITISHIEISGSSLSKAELQALVEGPWGLTTADTLSKFDAASITIPEIHVDVSVPVAGQDTPMSQSVVYRDIHVEDIKGGKAARISAAGMSSEVKGPVTLETSIGKLLATDYDFASVVRMVYVAAQPGEAQKAISGPSSIENMHSTSSNGVEMNIGRMNIGAVKARPLATPIAELAPAFKDLNPTDKSMAPAQAAKIVSLLADFYDAIAVDGMSASDITIKVPDPSLQNASIQTVKLGSLANSRFAELGIEGLDVNASGGHVKLGRGALLGLDIKPLLSSLSKAAKTGDLSGEVMKNLDWRNAVPHLDSIEVSNLDVTIPQGSSPQNLKLASYEIKLANYVGAIPTSLHSRLDKFVADASFLKDQALELQQLGYKMVDLSSGTDIAWDESSKALTVNEISAQGADMGSVLLKAKLGNVPRELFAGSPPQMQVAGLGVTLGEASLRLENSGLLDRIVARLAAVQKTTPDKLRAQWGTQAALGIPQLLGGSDSAKALGNAVASFLAKPKTLFVSVKAKDPNGLGITDLMAGGSPNPAAALEKLEIKAIANQ
ncbi:MAG: hypothetical protein JO068_07655 [Hyphomicrobiales bacterium]|nr:hypothetical protein [Hyphomicrobiales bacterium]